MKRYKTIYVKRRLAGKLGLDRFGSAGPHPNITGMKMLYWGMDAMCIRSGAYVYNVDQKTYIQAGGTI